MSIANLFAPTLDLESCAAGTAGLDGCRACVEQCPYGAIDVRSNPEGTQITIDPQRCQRCGACSGVCPTSAIERPFLTDAELVAALLVAAGLGDGPILAVTCAETAAAVGAVVGTERVVVVPSLLIINETHLLAPIAAGARAVLLVGCPSCTHGQAHSVRGPLSVTRAILGEPERVAYVAADRLDRLGVAMAAAERLTGRHRALSAREQQELHAATTRRDRLRVLLPLFGDRSTVPLTAVGFGTVEVDDPACVACGACAVACPTEALAFDPGAATLTVTDLECVGCGACASSCPDDAIRVLAEVPSGAAALRPRTLLVDEAVACRACGQAYAPRRLVDHARAVLTAAGLDAEDPGFQLGVCPACREIGTRHAPVDVDRGEDASGCACSGSSGGPCGPSDGACGGGACGCGDRHGNGSLLGEVVPRDDRPVGIPRMDRRGFLKGVGAATVAGAALPLVGAQPVEALSEPPVILPGRLGMVIDLNRCIGCHACTAACKAENHVPLGVYRDWVEEHTLGEYPHAKPVFLPKLCNHCDDPGCLRSCPTGAIFKREDGIVDIDHDICISCRACNQACPYGAAFMDPVRGTSDKCNLCAHRVDDGLNPACVDVCPSQCRIFGDLDDPDSAPSQALRGAPSEVLRPELGLGPNVHYLGLPGELNR